MGSHGVETLAGRGHAVRVLDEFSTGSRAHLDGIPAEIQSGDIRDRVAVERAVAGVHWVFHFAAAVSVAESVGDPRHCYDVNVLGTLTVLDAARRAGVSRAILASSFAV